MLLKSPSHCAALHSLYSSCVFSLSGDQRPAELRLSQRVAESFLRISRFRGRMFLYDAQASRIRNR